MTTDDDDYSRAYVGQSTELKERIIVYHNVHYDMCAPKGFYRKANLISSFQVHAITGFQR